MYIKVRVTAGAKKELLQVEKKNRLRISVKEPALRNRANKRVAELVAQWFEVPIKSVSLVSGHRHAVKMFSVGEEGDTIHIA